MKKTIEQLCAIAKKNAHSEVVLGTTEKTYVKQEQLGAYINSAQRVLKVRAACEDHYEIEDVLHLVFEGVRLSWCDFYFDYKDYFRCFSQVTQATVKVPVAIKGAVKANKLVKTRNGEFAVIDLVRPSRKTDRDGILDLACFSIWSPDLSAFESFKEGGEILAFGIWESHSVKESPNKKADSPIKVFRNHDLRLWPVTKSQLCVVKVGKSEIRAKTGATKSGRSREATIIS